MSGEIFALGPRAETGDHRRAFTPHGLGVKNAPAGPPEKQGQTWPLEQGKGYGCGSLPPPASCPQVGDRISKITKA